MPASLRFIPGTTIRWRARRFVIVDYAGLDALVAREIGKRRLHRVPLNEALVDLTPGDRNAWTPDLVSNRTISAVGTITAYGSPFCSTATRRVRRTCGRTNRTGNCFWEWHRRGSSHHPMPPFATMMYRYAVAGGKPRDPLSLVVAAAKQKQSRCKVASQP